MKKVLVSIIAVAIMGFSACKGLKKEAENLNGSHKVVVKEVVQANAYTYMNVVENDKEQWIAVPKMEAKAGDIYYFDGFMEMANFESKDLGRTFESVYFIEQVRTELTPVDAGHEGHNHGEDNAQMPAGHGQMDKHTGKPEVTQTDIKVEPAQGGITIAELFVNKDKYNGKKVMVRGKVVKANFEIMEKNWFHIQDGTSAEGKFDLTITSLEKDIKPNDIITFEGTIVLNKDFGYGYSYEVLMQDAIVK